MAKVKRNLFGFFIALVRFFPSIVPVYVGYRDSMLFGYLAGVIFFVIFGFDVFFSMNANSNFYWKEPSHLLCSIFPKLKKVRLLVEPIASSNVSGRYLFAILRTPLPYYAPYSYSNGWQFLEHIGDRSAYDDKKTRARIKKKAELERKRAERWRRFGNWLLRKSSTKEAISQSRD